MKTLKFKIFALVFLALLVYAVFPAQAHTLVSYAIAHPDGVATASVCLPIVALDHKLCGANPGGMENVFYYLDEEDLAEKIVPDEEGSLAVTSIPLPSGKYFKPFRFDDHEGEFRSLYANTGGHKHEFDIRRSFPDQVFDEGIGRILGKSLIIVALDKHGNVRIGGNLRSGMMLLSSEYKSGKKGDDAHGTDVKFQALGMLNHAFYYKGTISALLEP